MNIPSQVQKYSRLTAVAALHGALIYALLHSMQVSLTKPVTEKPLIDVFLPVKPQTPPPLRASQAQPKPKLPYIPPPVIAVQAPPDTPPQLQHEENPPEDTGVRSKVGGTSDIDTLTETIAPVVADKYVAPVVDMASCAKPNYPSASARNQEEGITRLAMHISSTGQVIETQIERSSGFSKLDLAAQNALSRCSFKPGTRNGVSESSWAKVEYVWKLD